MSRQAKRLVVQLPKPPNPDKDNEVLLAVRELSQGTQLLMSANGVVREKFARIVQLDWFAFRILERTNTIDLFWKAQIDLWADLSGFFTNLKSRDERDEIVQAAASAVYKGIRVITLPWLVIEAELPHRIFEALAKAKEEVGAETRPTIFLAAPERGNPRTYARVVASQRLDGIVVPASHLSEARQYSAPGTILACQIDGHMKLGAATDANLVIMPTTTFLEYAKSL